MTGEDARPWFRRIPSGIWGMLALVAGLVLGTYWPENFGWLQTGVGVVFGGLKTAAPYIIFFTIFAAVTGMMGGGGKAGKLAFWVTLTFTGLGILGGIIAILGAIPIFQLELARTTDMAAFLETLKSQVGNLIHSSQSFIAVIYAAFTAVLVQWATKWRGTRWIAEPTQRFIAVVGVDGITLIGRGLKTAFPFVLFAMGIFIPAAVGGAADRLAGTGAASSFSTIFGTNPIALYFLNVGIQVGLMAIYIGLVIAFTLWYTKFPIKAFFRDYFFLTYGFAWATSSSAAAIPVTLERTGEGLKVRKEVRDFVVPLGATMNLDGVMVAAFTITAFASIIVGYHPTALDLLLLLIPFKLVTMGVPGIPGGSAIVIPPVAAGILPFSPEQEIVFTAIWFAFAVGLSDQFRTGINTVTNGIVARIFETAYDRHFKRELPAGRDAPEPAPTPAAASAADVAADDVEPAR